MHSESTQAIGEVQGIENATGDGAPSAEDGAQIENTRPVIKIRDLRKVRRASDHQFELIVPEFDVFPGEFVVIVGSSGCGKSTLLDMLGLILAFDEGTGVFELCFRDGRSWDVRTLWEASRAVFRRRHFGYVLQSGGLLRFLSAKGNALLSSRLNGLRDGERDVMDLAKRFEVATQMGRYPGNLSGGQRQRTAIIRALSHKPEIVLADEPTASIDEVMAGRVIDELHTAARERETAVILVTHDSKLVIGKADRVYTFNVEAAPTPKGVREAVRSTMLEDPTHPARAPMGPKPAAREDLSENDNGLADTEVERADTGMTEAAACDQVEPLAKRAETSPEENGERVENTIAGYHPPNDVASLENDSCSADRPVGEVESNRVQTAHHVPSKEEEIEEGLPKSDASLPNLQGAAQDTNATTAGEEVLLDDNPSGDENGEAPIASAELGAMSPRTQEPLPSEPNPVVVPGEPEGIRGFNASQPQTAEPLGRIVPNGRDAPPQNAPGASAKRKRKEKHSRSGGIGAFFRLIWLMVRLALADVRHEWLMNLCLSLALVAVVAPLLLGLGLKAGMIKKIFDTFDKDPRYYEIASVEGAQTTSEMLAYLKERPEVNAVVRRLGSISSSVYVDAVLRPQTGGSAGHEFAERSLLSVGTVDLETTEGRDPLLLLSGAEAPLDDTPASGATGVVLNEAAAAKLGDGHTPVRAGDFLKIRVTRSLLGRLQEASWKLRVQAIAKLRSDAETNEAARFFVPLSFTEDIDLFKTGSPVESRKWLGGARAPAAPAIDAAIIVLRAQSGGSAPKDDLTPKDFVREIVGVSGWAEPRILTASQLEAQTGLRFALLKGGESGDVICYVAARGGDGASAGDFANLREFFRGRGYVPVSGFKDASGYSGIVSIIPWVAPKSMQLRRSGGVSPTLNVAGFSADADTVRFLGVKPEPPWPLWGPLSQASSVSDAAPPPASTKILVPPGDVNAGESPSLVVGQSGAGDLGIPVFVVVGGSASPKFTYISAELAGLLRSAGDGGLVWDETLKQFFHRRARYAGFRVYTHKVGEVIELERVLQMRGAKVQTRSAEISNAMELDHRLTALVRVIAVVGGAGALAVLGFSLFGSVERKRGDFSVLRLIGTGRLPLLVFPVFESMTVAVFAYLLAWWGVFAPVASWINRTIGPRFEFKSDEALCWLPLDMALQGLLLALGVSVVVAIAAGWRAMLADPAAALRQE